MSAKQRLREFITRQLVAVSDDICSVFQHTVDGYRTEMDRQRRLIDVVWNPDIQLHRTDLDVLCKDDPLPEQRRDPDSDQDHDQNQNQERDPGSDEEIPGPSSKQVESDPLQNPEHDSETSAEKTCVECDVCGKTFKLTFQLKRHLRRHAYEKPYLR